jgi:hypothetical protein
MTLCGGAGVCGLQRDGWGGRRHDRGQSRHTRKAAKGQKSTLSKLWVSSPPQQTQTSSKHVGRICGVKSTHWSHDSHVIWSIEFVGVAPLSHASLAWKCA